MADRRRCEQCGVRRNRAYMRRVGSFLLCYACADHAMGADCSQHGPRCKTCQQQHEKEGAHKRCP